ncbi:hypothetical protein [Agromyces luteolus]|uniref:Uncharacterized protein n=1 Tax=Agromyces luteolus TaxID=88373 RepID=A0A7C9LYM1_9MICO|nr:hypothetical protein [Agromyces luteolus]MUN06913.1 hypothetical protein [Agromyces luteolus]
MVPDPEPAGDQRPVDESYDGEQFDDGSDSLDDSTDYGSDEAGTEDDFEGEQFEDDEFEAGDNGMGGDIAGFVPSELVGVWSGGDGWWLTFAADGSYVWTGRNSVTDFQDSGVAIVSGSTLELYSASGTLEQMSFSIEPPAVEEVYGVQLGDTLTLRWAGGQSTYMRD